MTTLPRTETIHQRLIKTFSPTFIELIDESAHHAGHAGHGGAGHYKLRIASKLFEGKSLIESHQMIYQCLGDMIPNEIHAISISIL